jgi:hypothetical protein
LKNELVGEDTLQFVMHMSSHFSLTEFARKIHKDIKDQKSGKFWEDVKPHFLDHLEEANRNLASVGRPVLELTTKEVKARSVSSEEWQAVEEKAPTPPTL